MCPAAAEVYLQAFRSGDAPSFTSERYLVSSSGAQALRGRRDGSELFYLDFDGRVQAVPVKLSPKPEFGPTTALFTITTEARAAIHSVLRVHDMISEHSAVQHIGTDAAP